MQKFGGTSVQDVVHICRAADKAIAARKNGHDVAVVVSAMGKTTDELERLAAEVGGDGWGPPKREMDMLLSTGEQITIALMAMALEKKGQPAVSFTGGQVKMLTDAAHTKARIRGIDAGVVRRCLDRGQIAVVAGFQGVTDDNAITTLGRGGSNATLVALAAALKAEVCENYTDVDGVFTADPRKVPGARKIDRISYDEMLELSSSGAGVLQTRAVMFAKRHDVPIHVRNSQSDAVGTMVVAETPEMEDIAVSGAALKRDLIRVSLPRVADQVGIAARVFGDIAAADIVVDDIIQTVHDDGTATVSFTVEHGDLADVRPVVSELGREVGVEPIYADGLAKVSVVGVGMRSHTGVARTMFRALAEANVNIDNITTSEIKISCIIHERDAETALRTVHDAFELEKDPADRTPQR